MPSVSPWYRSKEMPSTALTAPICRLEEDALGQREVLDEVAYLEDGFTGDGFPGDEFTEDGFAEDGFTALDRSLLDRSLLDLGAFSTGASKASTASSFLLGSAMDRLLPEVAGAAAPRSSVPSRSVTGDSTGTSVRQMSWAAGAARVERATGRDAGQVGRQALDRVELLALLVQARDGVEQAPRVRVSGPLVQLVHRCRSTITARVHHRDLVGDVRDHAEVVGDEDQRPCGTRAAVRRAGPSPGPARSRRAPWSARPR